MITILTSTKEVMVDTFDKVLVKPKVAVNSYNKVAGSYIITGEYFYEEVEGSGEEAVTKKVRIRDFTKVMTDLEVDTIYSSLGITYPENSTESERDVIKITAGLRAILAIEKRWDLENSDWK